MSTVIVSEKGWVADWGVCSHPECSKPAHPMSGTHWLCVNHYADWHNGYAKHYGWSIIDPNEILQEVEEDAC
jgi:hypothetical protein